jgi:hypothetical protein
MGEPLPSPYVAPVNIWRTDGLARGLAYGAAAAVLAALIWYGVVVVTDSEFGIVAALLGWVVGTAAVIGSGRRGSMWLVGGSVLLTLAALVIAEYLIFYHIATQVLGPFDLLQSPFDIIGIVIDLLTSDPISLLFWAFALYTAASVPYKAIRGEPKPTTQPLPAAPNGQVGT